MGFKADCDGQSDLIFTDFAALTTSESDVESKMSALQSAINSSACSAALSTPFLNLAGAWATHKGNKAKVGGDLAEANDILVEHFGSAVGTNGGGIGCTRRRYDEV